MTPAEAKAVEQCQAITMRYLAWHRDADQRHKEGQRQVYCLTCCLWQWPDRVCPLAETICQKEFERRQKLAEQKRP